MTEIILSGFVGPDQTRSYLHLPFEVPTQTGRIDVRYEYSAAIGSDPQLTGGNTVDIGIFDPRGTQFHSPGFRGWSGSA
ncbi:MAG: phosphoesterase, partial [Anaerolineae bacterium]|nr:phosphoesterase [Anaerolineae bacterium]